jgi:hypothetical protein
LFQIIIIFEKKPFSIFSNKILDKLSISVHVQVPLDFLDATFFSTGKKIEQYLYLRYFGYIEHTFIFNMLYISGCRIMRKHMFSQSSFTVEIEIAD